MSRVLVVANETVEADELLAELRRIEDQGESVFRVVAPAVAADHGLGGAGARPVPSTPPRSGSIARSQC